MAIRRARTGDSKVSGSGRFPTHRPPPLDGILIRIQSLRPTLPPAAARIAAIIAENPAEVVHMSVTELADQAGASEGSVISLCRLVGATGFHHLKLALARDLVQPVQFGHQDLDRNDDVPAIISKVFLSGIQALHDTMKVLDRAALAQAVDLILAAERVELYGIGSSAPIADHAYYRMLRLGLNAKAVTDAHIQAISASLTNPTVAVIAVSHSGSTHETVTAMRLAKEAGAHTICITNFGKSPVQSYAEVVLHTMARESEFGSETMPSRIAQLCVVDALIACLSIVNYEQSAKAIRSTSEVLSDKRF